MPAFLTPVSFWRFALLLWTWSTLSFMAGMSVAWGLFGLASVIALWKLPAARACLKNKTLIAASLAFFAAAVLSVAAAFISPPLGLPLELPFSLQKFQFFLIPFLVCAALESTKGAGTLESHPIWKVFFGMTLFVSVIGIFQFWAASLLPASWIDDRFFRVIATGAETPRFHAQGLMYFHLSFASAMGFACAWAGARVLWPVQQDTSKCRAGFALLAVLSFLALFFTFSRIGWVALIGVMVCLAFLKKPKWGLLCALGIFCVGALVWNFSDAFRGRVNMGANSLFERKQVWSGALGMLEDRPLTGVGFGKTGYYSKPYELKVLGHEPEFSSQAHNNFLDIMAAMGFPGLLAFLAWWGVLAMFAWRAFREASEQERWLPAGCLAGLVAFHINGFTQVNFFDAKSQHSLMLWAGVVLALEWRRRQRKKIA